MKKLYISVCFLPLMALAQNQNIKKDSVQTIAEVILNAEKKLQVNHLDIPSLKAPMSINLMTSKMIEQQNLVRMEDVVQNIPGVHSVNQYGGFQFFNIRGFDDLSFSMMAFVMSGTILPNLHLLPILPMWKEWNF